MRRNAWVAPALCVGMLLAVGAQPLLAQRISLAPNIGVYIPTTELVKAASGEEFKQEVSITLGGRMGIFFTERLGLELTGAYSPSDLKITQSGLGDQNQDANVFTSSGRLSYQLMPYSSPIAFIVTGGVGVVNRSGSLYEGMENKTDIGGTLAASARFRIGSLLRLQSTPKTTYTSRRETSLASHPAMRKRPRTTSISRSASGSPCLGLGQMGK